MVPQRDHDLVVFGGGSAGFAAALAAARCGLKVLIVERGDRLGGTATQGGVNCWEPGVGGTGIPFELYRRMKQQAPDAIGVYTFGRHFCWQDGWHWPHALDKVNFPGGEMRLDPERRYLDTLRRHPGPGQAPTETWCRTNWHGVTFLPERMESLQQRMLAETGNVTVLLKRTVREARSRGGWVEGVTLDDGTVLGADGWIDGTGGALCQLLGCETLCGVDSRQRFGEAGAPESPTGAVNGVTLIYKVMPGYAETIEPLPAGVPAACWWAPHYPPLSCVEYPDRGRNCNMLPTMLGGECMALGPQPAYAECVRRVKAHWHFLQTQWPEFRTYRMTWIAPMLGIRESRRVVCERMLTEHDVRGGLSRQTDPDIVTVADHALDRHGEGGGCGELDEPYGVPYRCLIPKGWHNLLVAGRAAGFSSIAASSCRLTRTMMQLGQAAGTAVVLAQRGRSSMAEVESHALREALRGQHVQLAWPLPAALARHLAEE